MRGEAPSQPSLPAHLLNMFGYVQMKYLPMPQSTRPLQVVGSQRIGPPGVRADHQALACKPQPRSWLQGGAAGWGPGCAIEGDVMVFDTMLLIESLEVPLVCPVAQDVSAVGDPQQEHKAPDNRAPGVIRALKLPHLQGSGGL